MKLVLGMMVGLIAGDFVLDGEPAPSPKGDRAPFPIFGLFLLWPNGWMYPVPLGMDVGLSPGDFVLDGDPVPPPKRGGGGGAAPKNFRPMFIVAKQLDGSRCHLAQR